MNEFGKKKIMTFVSITETKLFINSNDIIIRSDSPHTFLVMIYGTVIHFECRTRYDYFQ